MTPSNRIRRWPATYSRWRCLIYDVDGLRLIEWSVCVRCCFACVAVPGSAVSAGSTSTAGASELVTDGKVLWRDRRRAWRVYESLPSESVTSAKTCYARLASRRGKSDPESLINRTVASAGSLLVVFSVMGTNRVGRCRVRPPPLCFGQYS